MLRNESPKPKPSTLRIHQTAPWNSPLFRKYLKISFKFTPFSSSSLLTPSLCSTFISLLLPTIKFSSFYRINAAIDNYEEAGEGEAYPSVSDEFEDLATNGAVYQKTLRLVECSMFAAVTGLLYFLSNSILIEVTMAMLLFSLSGPVKALIYLLTHGLVGFTMGSLWSHTTPFVLCVPDTTWDEELIEFAKLVEVLVASSVTRIQWPSSLSDSPQMGWDN